MKISDLAVLINGTVDSDRDINITGLSGTDMATKDDLTFAMDEIKLATAEKSQTACVLTTTTVRKSTKALIRVQNPKLAFLKCYRILHQPDLRKSSVHLSAVIAPTVKLGHDVRIDDLVSIGDNVTIGDHVTIESGCVIKSNCMIGDHCHLYPRVVLYANTVLRNNVVLHAGVVIGSDGFGYVKDNGVIYKFPQLGKAIIEENVEIGANTTIDRGSLEDTVIGANSKIDNLCHIAHNVKIGQGVLMAAQCGIAGSTVIGDNVVMSGQIAVIDNTTVGHNAVIGGKSAVIGRVDAHEVVWGVSGQAIGGGQETNGGPVMADQKLFSFIESRTKRGQT